MNSSLTFPRWLKITLVALAVGFVALRFVNLSHDTPMFYAHYGMSEVTDPYMYTSFARNRVLFDNWNPENYQRWTSWRVSLVSGFSYLIFLAGGVSRLTANLSGLILSLAGLLTMFIAWRRLVPKTEALIFAFLLALCSSLFFYGRAPFLETGLLFLSSLAIWIHFKYGGTLAGAALAGAVVAIGAFGGKLVGVTLLAPLALDYLLVNRQRFLLHWGALLVGFAVGATLYSTIFFSLSPWEMLAYFQSQTSAVGLSPVESDTISGWLYRLFAYGSYNGLFRFHPFLLALALGGACLTFLELGRRARPSLSADPHLRAQVFAIVWVLSGVALALPFDYRPFRYFLPYMPAVAALAAYAIARLLAGINIPRMRGFWSWASVMAIVVSVSYLFLQTESWWAQMIVVGRPMRQPISANACLLGAIIGLALALFLRRKPRLLNQRWSFALGLTALSLFGVRQSTLAVDGLFDTGNTLQQQSRDLRQLLGANALIAGNFAPACVIDNQHRSLIYPFGIENPNEKRSDNIFNEHQVTHVAESIIALQSAQSRFKELDSSYHVLGFFARETTFLLYGLDVPGYVSTDYERGMRYLSQSQPDSALPYLEKFLLRYPDNLTARLERVSVLAGLSQLSRALHELQALKTEYSDYYYVRYLVGRVYLHLGIKFSDAELLRQTIKEYSAVEKLNPYFSNSMDLDVEAKKISERLHQIRKI